MSGCNQIVTQSERGRGTNRKRINSEVNTTKKAEHPKPNLKGLVHKKKKKNEDLPLFSHPHVCILLFFPLFFTKVGIFVDEQTEIVASTP